MHMAHSGATHHFPGVTHTKVSLQVNSCFCIHYLCPLLVGNFWLLLLYCCFCLFYFIFCYYRWNTGLHTSYEKALLWSHTHSSLCSLVTLSYPCSHEFFIFLFNLWFSWDDRPMPAHLPHQ